MKSALFFFIIAFFMTVSPAIYGQKNPFEKDVNLAEVNISVRAENHSDCFDCIPEYEMSINGDGTVKFKGISGVKTKGEYTVAIPVEKVKELLADFKSVDFFSLSSEYRFKKLANGNLRTVDHAQAMNVSLKIGDQTKRVYSFYGAPDGLIAIQKKLNAISRELQNQNDGK